LPHPIQYKCGLSSAAAESLHSVECVKCVARLITHQYGQVYLILLTHNVPQLHERITCE
jgi:hypothetical protein